MIICQKGNPASPKAIAEDRLNWVAFTTGPCNSYIAVEWEAGEPAPKVIDCVDHVQYARAELEKRALAGEDVLGTVLKILDRDHRERWVQCADALSPEWTPYDGTPYGQ